MIASVTVPPTRTHRGALEPRGLDHLTLRAAPRWKSHFAGLQLSGTYCHPRRAEPSLFCFNTAPPSLREGGLSVSVTEGGPKVPNTLPSCGTARPTLLTSQWARAPAVELQVGTIRPKFHQ